MPKGLELLCCCIFLCGTSPSQALVKKQEPISDPYGLYLQTTVFERHFHFDAAHNNKAKLLGIEWGNSKHLWGFAHFKNSFYQPTSYLYYGWLWQFPYVYLKITAGLIKGYKGKYKHKIPFNSLGIAPAIIPTIGLRWQDFGAEVILLGNSALAIAVGYHITM